jgi:hypothetical protein
MTMARGGQNFRREMVPRAHGMNASQDSPTQPHEKRLQDRHVDVAICLSGVSGSDSRSDLAAGTIAIRGVRAVRGMSHVALSGVALGSVYGCGIGLVCRARHGDRRRHPLGLDSDLPRRSSDQRDQASRYTGTEERPWSGDGQMAGNWE